MQRSRNVVLRLLSINYNAFSLLRSSRWPLQPCSASFAVSANGSDNSQTAEQSADERRQFAATVEKTKGAALRLLSQRSHSRKELQTKLEEWEYPEAAIRPALNRLEEVGLQSDAEFADVFTRSKWRQAKWAPSRIKSELTRRGVSPELSREALESVFGSDGLQMRRFIDEELEEADFGPLVAPEGALLQAARRQFELTKGLSAEARQRRLVGWLTRRGHPWEVVSHVIRRLKVEEERQEEESRGGS